MLASPTMAAKPTIAIRPCTSTSEVAKARERAWLKPSATRSRMNPSSSSLRTPMRFKVSRASSPSSSHVSGTDWRCS